MLNGALPHVFLLNTRVRRLVICLDRPQRGPAIGTLLYQVHTIIVVCNGKQSEYVADLLPLLHAAARCGTAVTLVGSESAATSWAAADEAGLLPLAAQQVLESGKISRESHKE